MFIMLKRFSFVPQNFFTFFFSTGSGSWSGSWFYFGFQYQTYISYIEVTHQILFRKLLCPQPGSTYVQPDNQTDIQTHRQTDRRTDGNFFCLFYRLRHTKHEHSSKGENFFSTHAITILSLFMWWEGKKTTTFKLLNSEIEATY